MDDYDSVLKGLCLLLLFIYILFVIYYIYLARTVIAKCTSEKVEELPCPNTCNPGYECTQTEPPNEFVIGEVVQESMLEEAETEVQPESEVQPETQPEAEVQPEPGKEIRLDV
jgi:hypothetical protein